MSKGWVMGMGIALWVLLANGLDRSARGQSFDLGTVEIQQGTILSVSPAGAGGPQFFNSDTVAAFNVVLDQALYDDLGQLLLPAGSKFYGRIQPAPGGVEFVAQTLVVNGRSYSIAARSAILPDQKDPRQYTPESIIGDGAIGAAAGAVLGIVTGGVGLTGVLGGAASGVVVGNVTANQTVVLQPGQTFDLILDAPIRI